MKVAENMKEIEFSNGFLGVVLVIIPWHTKNKSLEYVFIDLNPIHRLIYELSRI